MVPMAIDAGDLLVIVILAAVLFGPEKLPELVKKVSRVIRFLRNVANSATESIKSELGPEFADLTPADLQPKRLVQRLVLSDVQDDLDDIKTQVTGLQSQLTSSLDPASAVTADTLKSIRDGLSGIGHTVDKTASAMNKAAAGALDMSRLAGPSDAQNQTAVEPVETPYELR